MSRPDSLSRAHLLDELANLPPSVLWGLPVVVLRDVLEHLEARLVLERDHVLLDGLLHRVRVAIERRRLGLS